MSSRVEWHTIKRTLLAQTINLEYKLIIKNASTTMHALIGLVSGEAVHLVPFSNAEHIQKANDTSIVPLGVKMALAALSFFFPVLGILHEPSRKRVIRAIEYNWKTCNELWWK